MDVNRSNRIRNASIVINLLFIIYFLSFMKGCTRDFMCGEETIRTDTVWTDKIIKLTDGLTFLHPKKENVTYVAIEQDSLQKYLRETFQPKYVSERGNKRKSTIKEKIALVPLPEPTVWESYIDTCCQTAYLYRIEQEDSLVQIHAEVVIKGGEVLNTKFSYNIFPVTVKTPEITITKRKKFSGLFVGGSLGMNAGGLPIYPLSTIVKLDVAYLIKNKNMIEIGYGYDIGLRRQVLSVGYKFRLF
jgi:hypothetical protein